MIRTPHIRDAHSEEDAFKPTQAELLPMVEVQTGAVDSMCCVCEDEVNEDQHERRVVT
jgi:hypothetical protein